MTIDYNVTGTERKKQVQTITEISECDAKYHGSFYLTVSNNPIFSSKIP